MQREQKYDESNEYTKLIQSHPRLILGVVGKSKTGKSHLCNELLGIQKSKYKLFAEESNPLTSYNTYYSYYPQIEKSHYFLTNKCQLIESFRDQQYLKPFHNEGYELEQTKAHQTLRKLHQEKQESSVKKQQGLKSKDCLCLKGNHRIVDSQIVSKYCCLCELIQQKEQKDNEQQFQDKLIDHQFLKGKKVDQKIKTDFDNNSILIVCFKCTNGVDNLTIKQKIKDCIQQKQNHLIYYNLDGYLRPTIKNQQQYYQKTNYFDFLKNKYFLVPAMFRKIYDQLKHKDYVKLDEYYKSDRLKQLNEYIKQNEQNQIQGFKELLPILQEINMIYPLQNVFFLGAKVLSQPCIMNTEQQNNKRCLKLYLQTKCLQMQEKRLNHTKTNLSKDQQKFQRIHKLIQNLNQDQKLEFKKNLIQIDTLLKDSIINLKNKVKQGYQKLSQQYTQIILLLEGKQVRTYFGYIFKSSHKKEFIQQLQTVINSVTKQIKQIAQKSRNDIEQYKRENNKQFIQQALNIFSQISVPLIQKFNQLTSQLKVHFNSQGLTSKLFIFNTVLLVICSIQRMYFNNNNNFRNMEIALPVYGFFNLPYLINVIEANKNKKADQKFFKQQLPKLKEKQLNLRLLILNIISKINYKSEKSLQIQTILNNYQLIKLTKQRTTEKISLIQYETQQLKKQQNQ